MLDATTPFIHGNDVNAVLDAFGQTLLCMHLTQVEKVLLFFGLFLEESQNLKQNEPFHWCVPCPGVNF